MKEVPMPLVFAGKIIEAKRIKEKISREQLSKKIGIARQTLYNVEKGVDITSIPTLIKICSELEIHLKDLFPTKSRQVEIHNDDLIMISSGKKSFIVNHTNFCITGETLELKSRLSKISVFVKVTHTEIYYLNENSRLQIAQIQK